MQSLETGETAESSPNVATELVIQPEAAYMDSLFNFHADSSQSDIFQQDQEVRRDITSVSHNEMQNYFSSNIDTCTNDESSLSHEIRSSGIGVDIGNDRFARINSSVQNSSLIGASFTAGVNRLLELDVDNLYGTMLDDLIQTVEESELSIRRTQNRIMELEERLELEIRMAEQMGLTGWTSDNELDEVLGIITNLERLPTEYHNRQRITASGEEQPERSALRNRFALESLPILPNEIVLRQQEAYERDSRALRGMTRGTNETSEFSEYTSGPAQYFIDNEDESDSDRDEGEDEDNIDERLIQTLFQLHAHHQRSLSNRNHVIENQNSQHYSASSEANEEVDESFLLLNMLVQPLIDRNGDVCTDYESAVGWDLPLGGEELLKFGLNENGEELVNHAVADGELLKDTLLGGIKHHNNLEENKFFLKTNSFLKLKDGSCVGR